MRTSLPFTRPSALGKLICSWWLDVPDTWVDARATPVAPMSTMAMAMPVTTDLVSFIPSVHPQRAFRRGVEELVHELVVGLLGLALGAEEAHLPLVEDADVVRKT